MIADVIFTVAMVAVATGAVPELQFWVGNIGPAADGAAVGIGRGLLGSSFFLREGDRTRFLLCIFLHSPVLPSAAGPPSRRQQIQCILSCKQQEIGNTYQREQIAGEDECVIINLGYNDYQIYNRQDPGLNRNYKENIKLAVRIHSSKGQYHAQVHEGSHLQIQSQVGLCCLCRKYQQCKRAHKDHSGKVIQIKPESTHGLLQMATKHIKEINENNGKNATGVVCKHIGEQTPNLSLQDELLIKVQKAYDEATAVEQR